MRREREREREKPVISESEGERLLCVQTDEESVLHWNVSIGVCPATTATLESTALQNDIIEDGGGGHKDLWIPQVDQ